MLAILSVAVISGLFTRASCKQTVWVTWWFRGRGANGLDNMPGFPSHIFLLPLVLNEVHGRRIFGTPLKCLMR